MAPAIEQIERAVINSVPRGGIVAAVNTYRRLNPAETFRDTVAAVEDILIRHGLAERAPCLSCGGTGYKGLVLKRN